MNQLTTTRADNPFLVAIANTVLAETTKQQYSRAIIRAVDAGVNLMDATAVAEYARPLPSSSRAFLRSAIRLLAADMALKLKAGATPDPVEVAKIQAALWRLEALQETIQLQKSVGQKAHVWLSGGEVAKLSSLMVDDDLKGKRDKVLMGVLLGAGLRRDELARLRWKQIVMQGSRAALDIVGKGRKKRSVPISKSLAELLADFRLLTGAADNERVLIRVNKGGNFSGFGMSGTAIYKIVQSWGGVIGRPELQPHDCRRTYARLGYEAGIPVSEISKLLGHSSVAVTEGYLNVMVRTDRTVGDFVPF